MNADLFQRISSFTPEDGYFLPLDELLFEAFDEPDPTEYFDAMFNLFHRFHDEDGAGVLWTILHGMESVGGYEVKLLANILTKPSVMGEAMLARLRNSGVSHIDGTAISPLLDEADRTG